MSKNLKFYLHQIRLLMVPNDHALFARSLKLDLLNFHFHKIILFFCSFSIK